MIHKTLNQAVLADDIEDIKFKLKGKINKKNFTYSLTNSCLLGKTEILRLLLDKNNEDKLFTVDKLQDCLWLSIRHSQIQSIKILLEYNVVKKSEHMKYICEACKISKTHVLEYLLELKDLYDLEELDKGIIEAFKYGKLSNIKLLLNKFTFDNNILESCALNATIHSKKLSLQYLCSKKCFSEEFITHLFSKSLLSKSSLSKFLLSTNNINVTPLLFNEVFLSINKNFGHTSTSRFNLVIDNIIINIKERNIINNIDLKSLEGIMEPVFFNRLRESYLKNKISEF